VKNEIVWIKKKKVTKKVNEKLVNSLIDVVNCKKLIDIFQK